MLKVTPELFAGEMTFAADRNATELNKPVRRMYCACCGESYHGRQWADQDIGHGLGNCCFAYVKAKYHDDEARTFEQCYGIDGIHYNISENA